MATLGQHVAIIDRGRFRRLLLMLPLIIRLRYLLISIASVLFSCILVSFVWAQGDAECLPGFHHEGCVKIITGPEGPVCIGGHCVKNARQPVTRFVAWQNSGFQDGSAVHPFQTLPTALAVAVPGDTIAIRTGSYNLNGGLINKKATFRAYFGTATITGEPSVQGPAHLPFDLVLRGNDVNNLPRNPTWGYLFDLGLPPDPTALCKVSDNPADWYSPPKACTHDRVTVDHSGNCDHGHVNWSVATYEGIVRWQDHSTSDDDYNIQISTLDQSLYTRWNPYYVLMEFDSDETIDHFDRQRWWKSFHRDVDSGKVNPGGINGAFATVTGLVGLDAEHKAHSELHPVYSLAINYDHQGGWSFFVRNWGNEGACGHQDHLLSLDTIRILLPRPFATDGQVISQDVWGTNSTGGVWWFAPGEGLVLEFHLPLPSSHGFVFGDVRVQWTEQGAIGPKFSQIVAPPVGHEGHEDDFEARLNRIIQTLSDDQRSQYKALTRSLGSQGILPAPFTRITLPHVDSRERQNLGRPVTVNVAPSDHQNRRLKALCSVLKGIIPEFPDLCSHLTNHSQSTK